MLCFSRTRHDFLMISLPPPWKAYFPSRRSSFAFLTVVLSGMTQPPDPCFRGSSSSVSLEVLHLALMLLEPLPRVGKVPRLRRFPDASFLREYKRNCPDSSFRIMPR